MVRSLTSILGCLATFLLRQTSAAGPSNCSSSQIHRLTIPGAQILDLTANPVHNYATSSLQLGITPTANYTNLNFCNVTVTYTHPGYNDSIHVFLWLPDIWNGRFQGTGGGGWRTGYTDQALAYAITQGYAAASTDSGHGGMDVSDPAPWALLGPGMVNYDLLQDMASTALNELASIGKAVTASFYGRPAAFSYWTGCSTGGRQGLMLAQRYPSAFDGILALAPAVYWPQLLVALYWSQQVMNSLQYYPLACELDSIMAAAIKACDGVDGVVDGIISLPDQCHFDALSLVGKRFDCDGVDMVHTIQAAQIANAAWSGPHNSSLYSWYGSNRDASLTALGGTTCTANTTSSCTGNPFLVPVQWIKTFVVKNTAFNITAMSYQDYTNIFHQSIQEYESIMGSSDPDLSHFRQAGGKMITWHGLADQAIFPNGTLKYYNSVLALDPHAQDFYRVFEAPGTQHCGAGVGPYPNNTLEALVDWVEHGRAPATLTAVGESSGVVRKLCPYPATQRYVGGDPDVTASFRCE